MKNNSTFPERKTNRLRGYDYSSDGVYFVTICTQNKKCILGSVVGDGLTCRFGRCFCTMQRCPLDTRTVLDVPKMTLSKYGKIADEQISLMNCIYDNIVVEKYVIMPNHIHLLIHIENKSDSGTSRTPSPTNSIIAAFVSTFKRYTNKKTGDRLWQRSYHDHIVRNENEYIRIWEYINSNAQKWQSDKYYVGG